MFFFLEPRRIAICELYYHFLQNWSKTFLKGLVMVVCLLPIMFLVISYMLSGSYMDYCVNLYFTVSLMGPGAVTNMNSVCVMVSSLVIIMYLWNLIFIMGYNQMKLDKFLIKYLFAGMSFIFYLFALELWFNFDIQWPGYQFLFGQNNLCYKIQFSFGIDGLALCFIMLTAFMFALMFSYLIFDANVSVMFLFSCMLIEIFLFLSFSTINLLLFYVFFESVLMPMFLMMMFWGSSSRKIKAGFYFLLYTLVGSIFLLYAMLYMYTSFGTLNYMDFNEIFLSPDEEIILWFLFFLPFAVKMPTFPFHIWLPEAHVEAPTIGSMILASLLLKLGGYGLIRFTLALFPTANMYFFPLISILSLLGILNASFMAMRQSDIKRMMAYSSIAHMNLIVLGIFSLNKYSLDGSMYLMMGHGLVSTALFFCVGVLYDRYHTRLMQYYGGLVQVMPKFTLILLIFTFANMGFPGTMNFMGEFLMLFGMVDLNFFCGLIASLSTVLSAMYSIYLFNRMSYGTMKIFNNKFMVDLTIPELSFLWMLSTLTILFGLKSAMIMQSISMIVY